MLGTFADLPCLKIDFNQIYENDLYLPAGITL